MTRIHTLITLLAVFFTDWQIVSAFPFSSKSAGVSVRHFANPNHQMVHNTRRKRKVGMFSSQYMSINSDDMSVVPGIGDEGCKLPSPSAVNTLPTPVQAAIFLSYFAGLALGTSSLVKGIDFFTAFAPGPMETWMGTWPLLGAIFIAAGITHFTLKDMFLNIMPAQGAWGIWYLPGSKFFHVAWTGVAEFVLGSWLVLGAGTKLLGVLVLPSLLGADPVAEASLGLFLLTIAVTPANVYMFTHGAKLVGTTDMGTAEHAFRFVMQCVILAMFFEMSVLH